VDHLALGNDADALVSESLQIGGIHDVVLEVALDHDARYSRSVNRAPACELANDLEEPTTTTLLMYNQLWDIPLKKFK
jgi:hypothetical protein